MRNLKQRVQKLEDGAGRGDLLFVVDWGDCMAVNGERMTYKEYEQYRKRHGDPDFVFEIVRDDAPARAN